VVRVPIERIPKIPEPARAVLRNAVWTYGKATSFARPLPDFLIVGAQKAGTTALYAYLLRHRAIVGPSWKEVSFFDRHFARGAIGTAASFRTRFGSEGSERRTGVTPLAGERAPATCSTPLRPKRSRSCFRTFGSSRSSAIRSTARSRTTNTRSRSTASRCRSRRRSIRRSSACEASSSGCAIPAYFSYAWWNFTYASRGLYAEQLDRWLAVFPREQLLIVPSEDLLEQPRETYARVLEFLGAPPHELDSYPRIFVREYEAMDPKTRQRLSARFAEPNARLYELLGRDLGWS
jgi:hypothetical protein